MTGEILHFPPPTTSLSANEGKTAAERFLNTSVEERRKNVGEYHLDQSETLLCLCQRLEERIETTPANVAEDAEFLYAYLEGLPAQSGSFLFDEREYYLGEFSLLAGCAYRILTRRDDARAWFDRAEAWFLLTANVAGDIARLGYQRLALKVEERKFDEVLKLIPPLSESFRRLKATELALKCRFIEGQVLKETDRPKEAVTLFEEIRAEAASLGNDRLLGLAYCDLIQLHAVLGEPEEALRLAPEAAAILRRLDNQVGLAKMQCGLGMLFRTQGNLPQSIEAFRLAQKEFADIQMRADVAAIHLIVADLSLELGQERQAEWEIRQALPVIDELKMVPEGVAALSLLRESLRRRSIDRQALRDLHGYFDDSAK